MSRPLVVLGVTGGIAAYKSADLIRRLKDQELEVQVIATNSALKFVGETTFAALSGKPVISDIWDKAHDVEHVKVAKNADAIVVAPATADFLAHLVYGFANDALLATLLVAKCPIILAPAMHTEMWENSATRENVATLRKRLDHQRIADANAVQLELRCELTVEKGVALMKVLIICIEQTRKQLRHIGLF